MDLHCLVTGYGSKEDQHFQCTLPRSQASFLALARCLLGMYIVPMMLCTLCSLVQGSQGSENWGLTFIRYFWKHSFKIFSYSFRKDFEYVHRWFSRAIKQSFTKNIRDSFSSLRKFFNEAWFVGSWWKYIENRNCNIFQSWFYKCGLKNNILFHCSVKL